MISESYSAVEAIARDLTGDNTLGEAIKTLRTNRELNSQLLTAIDKIISYAHTSRHGQPTADTHPAGQDEALLMFGVCAAIAGYLTTKASKINPK